MEISPEDFGRGGGGIFAGAADAKYSNILQERKKGNFHYFSTVYF
jgi:hypothetical protein